MFKHVLRVFIHWLSYAFIALIDVVLVSLVDLLWATDHSIFQMIRLE